MAFFSSSLWQPLGGYSEDDERLLTAGSYHLTYEELSTLLCQIEATINSRPLLPLGAHDEDELEALSPGHFLIG